MRREHLLAVALGAAAFISGCAGDACTRHSDCDLGLVCGPAATCVAPPDAAVVADATVVQPDAAPLDAALPDAALPDAALPDAAPADAAVMP